MTDYLAESLALLEDWEEGENWDWPEKKRVPAYGAISALEEAGPPAALGREAAGETGSRRVDIDAMLQVHHWELEENGQGALWRRLFHPAGDQDPPADTAWERAWEAAFWPEEELEDPDRRGGAAEGGSALLAQLQKSGLAAQNSRRRDAPEEPGWTWPLAQSRGLGTRREEETAQGLDAVQRVDRAFRRDARRYDGGFSLF